MAFSVGSSSSLSAEINVTPLIDVLLVLLIIFMVVLPAPSSGMDSSLPQGKPATARQQPLTVRLVASVAGNGIRYEVAGRATERDEVAQRLSQIFAMRQDRTLFVQADRMLSYQDVADVVSEARQAGAGAVVLSSLH